MNSTKLLLSTRFHKIVLKFLVFVGILTISGTVFAQKNMVMNGDFKQNAAAFKTSPGTLGKGNPQEIPCWKLHPTATSKGINGATTKVGSIFGPVNHDGQTYAFVQGGGTGIYQYLPVTPNREYTLEIDVAARADNYDAVFSIRFANAGQEDQPFWDSRSLNDGNPNPASQDGFIHYSAPIVIPGNAAGVNIQLWNENPPGEDTTICFANVAVLAPFGESTHENTTTSEEDSAPDQREPTSSLL